MEMDKKFLFYSRGQQNYNVNPKHNGIDGKNWQPFSIICSFLHSLLYCSELHICSHLNSPYSRSKKLIKKTGIVYWNGTLNWMQTRWEKILRKFFIHIWKYILCDGTRSNVSLFNKLNFEMCVLMPAKIHKRLTFSK